jgi:PhnB protein
MATTIPEGQSSLTPHLVVKGAAEAIEFYKRAFDASELFRLPAPDGTLMHATLQIGNAKLMLADEQPEGAVKAPTTAGAATSSLMLYVGDVDSVYASAIKAGARPLAPVQNMFWGDRWGMVSDPFGQVWQIATRLAKGEAGEESST